MGMGKGGGMCLVSFFNHIVVPPCGLLGWDVIKKD